MVDRAEGLRDVPLARVGRQALVARGTFRMIDRASALRKVPLGSAAPRRRDHGHLVYLVLDERGNSAPVIMRPRPARRAAHRRLGSGRGSPRATTKGPARGSAPGTTAMSPDSSLRRSIAPVRASTPTTCGFGCP